jgi:hypothetical protein
MDPNQPLERVLEYKVCDKSGIACMNLQVWGFEYSLILFSNGSKSKANTKFGVLNLLFGDGCDFSFRLVRGLHVVFTTIRAI